MSNVNDIPTSLRLPSQLPLDSKLWTKSKEDIKSLGVGSQLAYTYYKGLRIYCADEQEIYEWKEPESGDTLLLTTSFVYPNGIMSNGIDYSNKVYNFSLVREINQNNKIQYLEIDISEFAESIPPTRGDIVSYLNNLEESQRIIIGEEEIYKIGITFIDYASVGDLAVPKFRWYNEKYIAIFDLVNIGKGRLPDLVENNVSLTYYQEVFNYVADSTVKTIYIVKSNLPINYTKQDIIDYLLSLDESERTIEPFNSKVNIVLIEGPS